MSQAGSFYLASMGIREEEAGRRILYRSRRKQGPMIFTHVNVVANGEPGLPLLILVSPTPPGSWVGLQVGERNGTSSSLIQVGGT